MRVLHIERDDAVAANVALVLDAAAIAVVRTDEADDGIDLAKRYDFDAVVLEPAGLEVSGAMILRRLRDAKVATPVLVLTKDTVLAAQLGLLDAGADDVLSKPFHSAELRSRVRAVARRGRGHAEPCVTIGDLELSFNSQSVRVCGRPLHLTTTEFAIVETLALRRNSVVTREMILDRIYAGRDEPEMKIIDVFVCKLRKKIAAIAGHGAVETIWGRGFMLRDHDLIPVS